MTLLVGFAPGKAERSGLEYAATLARSSGQDLLVVAVVPAPWPTPAAANTDKEFAAWSRNLGESAVAEMSELVREHCPDIEARTIWAHGRSAPSVLNELAVKHDVAMIVLGSGHGGGYGRVHVSSTADRLLHSAPVPVAIATRGYQSGPGQVVPRATCAFRGDAVSRRTLERTAEICAEIGASLRVATFAVRGRTMYPPEIGTSAEDMVLEAWVEQTTRAQEEAIAALPAVPAQVESVVGSGPDWDSALGQLHWLPHEVLVVGSSSASVMSRLFLGFSATKIVRHAPAPVIVVG